MMSKCVESSFRVLVFCGGFFVAGAFLQMPLAQAASVSVTGTATIVTPISITSIQNLVYGKIEANTGGTVILSTTGARTKTGAVTLVSTGSAQNQAIVRVAGVASSTYSITLPADGTVNLSDGASHTMPVSTFVSNPSGTGTLSASGTQDVNIGATLVVASAQAANAYTGSFSVSVDYN